MCLQIFQFQIQKTSKTSENVKWSHGLSKGGETKISPSWSQVIWGGKLIGLVQYDDRPTVTHGLCIDCVLESTLITRVAKDFMAKITHTGVRSGSRLAN